MLSTKLKFSTDLIPIADQYKLTEFASPIVSSFASHVHTLHDEISDKIAQNNTNHGIRIDDRNKLNTFNVDVYIQKFHACNSDQF